MNKSWLKIVGLVLLVAFIGYLILVELPSKPEAVRRPVNSQSNSYEPKFKKEATLFLIQPDTRDTIEKLDIELAETREEISYGMMYRKSMDPSTGMLFLMEEERQQSFYMKNTFVSLDIIFINDDLEIVSIQKNAEPLNERSLPSEGPASYILEVKGGYSDQHGIVKGTIVAFERDN